MKVRFFSVLLLIALMTLSISKAQASAPPSCTISGVVYAPDGTTVDKGVVTFAPNPIPQIVNSQTIYPRIVSSPTDGSGNLQAIALYQGISANVTICQRGGSQCGAPVAISVPVAGSISFAALLAGTEVPYTGFTIDQLAQPATGNYNMGGFSITDVVLDAIGGSITGLTQLTAGVISALTATHSNAGFQATGAATGAYGFAAEVTGDGYQRLLEEMGTGIQVSNGSTPPVTVIDETGAYHWSDYTEAAAPRATFGGSAPGTLGGGGTPVYGQYTPSAAITITGWDMTVITVPSGCSTYASFNLDVNGNQISGSVITLASATNTYHVGSLSINDPAAGPIDILGTVAAAGCGTSAANGSFTVEFTTN